jgi:peptide/nickel transport system substrate-binding protein
MAAQDENLNRITSSLLHRDVSRRSLLKRGLAAGLSTPVFASLLAACAEDEDVADDDAPPAAEPDDDVDDVEEPVDDVDDEDEEEEPDVEDDELDDEEEPGDDAEDDRYGGTLNVAITGDPTGLDIQWILGGFMTLIGMHMWETLLTWDEDFEPVPELAESIDVQDDGLNIVIELREGVLFHNGDEMTAEDVIASLERWGELSPRSGGFVDTYDELEAVDDYTVEIRMNESLGPLTTLLSRYPGCCGIYPASVIEASDGQDLAEIVGTGPYEFVEFLSDQHVHVRRFEDYVGRDEEPSGYAGRKYQYLDEIFFIPIPDEAARIAGLQAGDYHYLQEIGSDHYETLDDHEETVAEIPPRTQPIVWILNMREGICANQSMRQALQAAVDPEEVLIAGFAEGFADLDPSLTLPETAWYTRAGEEYFNQADPDRARELAEEAGYDGEPIRFMTSGERQALHDMALVTTQQWEDAGFNIDLQVMDWATLQERRDIPGDWDVFTTNFGFFPDPIMIPNVAGSTWSGWWDTDEKNELTRQFWTESDFDTRFELWEEIQRLAYEEVPQIMFGHASVLVAHSARLQDAPEYTQLGASFWNSWAAWARAAGTSNANVASRSGVKPGSTDIS